MNIALELRQQKPLDDDDMWNVNCRVSVYPGYASTESKRRLMLTNCKQVNI